MRIPDIVTQIDELTNTELCSLVAKAKKLKYEIRPGKKRRVVKQTKKAITKASKLVEGMSPEEKANLREALLNG